MQTLLINASMLSYDTGDNPIKYKDTAKPRENMGAIIYEHKWFGGKRPRKLEVILPNLDKDDRRMKCIPSSCKDDLIAMKPFHHTENILIMHNMQPKWSQNLNGYVLNFHGH